MIKNWIDRRFPYRPGAGRTGDRFGLRSDTLGSPIHIGDDRSGSPDHYVMPYDGRIFWNTEEDTSWGSILRLVPSSSKETEIQVAHSVRRDGLNFPLKEKYKQGQLLPVITGNIGMTTAPHSHTVWLIQYTDENYKYFLNDGEFIADEKKINEKYVKLHCDRVGMDYAKTIDAIKQQIIVWGIREVYTNFAVRKYLPLYRIPQWGEGTVIIADPMLYLDI